MAHPARVMPENDPEGMGAGEAGIVPVGPNKLPPSLPVVLNARELAATELRYVDVPAVPAAPVPPARPLLKKKRRREAAVLQGLADLQQLQKQTIAVLEAVKGALDDIQQVLRSPEATRGMEKQQNAAMLLAKGFAREAVEQAQGAAGLLPANPEAHLLLSLSLAADQQFDPSLAAARKGLALFDRRTHPLAIEAGLLHALAALGCGTEAVERWEAIIDGLPLPVLFENMGRIGACFPSEVSGGGSDLLDDLVNRRLARDEQKVAEEESGRPRVGKIDTRPDEIPAPALFAGLDAARDFQLSNTHRAILGQVARRLQMVREGGDVVKFLTECVVPLGNRGLDKSAEALGRAAVKRLLKLQADAMTLHRAMGKLEMAGAADGAREIAALLNHWRRAGNAVVRGRVAIGVSMVLLLGGAAVVGEMFLKAPIPPHPLPGMWPAVGPGAMVAGILICAVALFTGTGPVVLPNGRPALTREERAYLNTASVKQSVRGVLAGR